MSKSGSIRLVSSEPESLIRLTHGVGVVHHFPCHIHNSYTLGWIEQGQRVVGVDGVDYPIGAGECFFLNPYQPHTIDGAREHDYWAVSIHPAALQPLFTRLTGALTLPFFAHVRVSDPAVTRVVAGWFQKQSAGDPIQARGELLDRILPELLERYAIQRPAMPCHPMTQTARDFIDAHLESVIPLEDIASRAHVSPFYLNRVFREEIGVPPYTYLLQKRIHQSFKVLLEMHSVAAAAVELGFADQSHFTRMFKKNVGITPGKFLEENDPEPDGKAPPQGEA